MTFQTSSTHLDKIEPVYPVYFADAEDAGGYITSGLWGAIRTLKELKTAPLDRFAGNQDARREIEMLRDHAADVLQRMDIHEWKRLQSAERLAGMVA